MTGSLQGPPDAILGVSGERRAQQNYSLLYHTLNCLRSGQGPTPNAVLTFMRNAEAFKKDQSSQKINLGVGAYRTEEGKPLVLNVVKKAEQKIVNDPSENKVDPSAFDATSVLSYSTSNRCTWHIWSTLGGVLTSCQTVAVLAVQEYLGITGNPVFNELSAKLAFGENSSVIREKRNATVQALSGTGSLRVSTMSTLLRSASERVPVWVCVSL